MVVVVKRRVFLSYGHQDRAFVRFLANDVRATSVSIWMDELEILPGDSLIGKISEGLSDSDHVVACLSKSSVQSEWVRTELEIAATRGIREKQAVVLPLLVNGVESQDIPTFLSHLLYVDFRRAAGYDDALEQLVRRIAPDQLVRGEGELAAPLQSNVLTIDASRAQQLVAAASSGLLDWVTSYLISSVKKPDPTERHWIYWALGKIGGKAAEDLLEKGLEDVDEFARLSAQSWRKRRAADAAP